MLAEGKKDRELREAQIVLQTVLKNYLFFFFHFFTFFTFLSFIHIMPDDKKDTAKATFWNPRKDPDSIKKPDYLSFKRPR